MSPVSEFASKWLRSLKFCKICPLWFRLIWRGRFLKKWIERSVVFYIYHWIHIPIDKRHHIICSCTIHSSDPPLSKTVFSLLISIPKVSRWLSQKSPAWSNLTSHHAQRALRGLFARQRVIYRFTASERTAAGQDLSPLPSWWWMSGELSKSEHRVTSPENAMVSFNFFKIKKININRTKCNRDFRSCSIEAIHIINRIQ